MLIIYSLFCLFLFKSKSKVLKIVAFYLVFSCFLDIINTLVGIYLIPNVISDMWFLSIIYRLGELAIIGYLINSNWLKNKFMFIVILLSSLYLIYDLFTYRLNGIFNYTANAQIVANTVLLVMLLVNLIKQLKSMNMFNLTHQMLNMIFLSYFSIHLVFTVISNFIINQSYSNNSFIMLYCGYAILHIVYYSGLAFVLYKNYKNSDLVKKSL